MKRHIPTSEIKKFLIALTARVRSGGNTTAILSLRILWIVYKNRRESEIILQIVLVVKGNEDLVKFRREISGRKRRILYAF